MTGRHRPKPRAPRRGSVSSAQENVSKSLSRFRPYPAYKDSGVEWLSQIPAHWQARRLKHLASLNQESLREDTNPELQIVYVDIGGVDSLGRIVEKESLTFGSAPSRARRLVHDGDVIVSTVRTYLRAITPIIKPEPNLVVSTGFAVVKPGSDFTTAYAAYALRAPYFVERVVANSKGVSFPAINESEMAAYALAVPPPREQRAIASFLDLETSRIDALMAKKKRLLELLQEQRAALIARAVTRGVEPNAAMKESRVQWLGQVPAHWQVRRLKYLASLNQESLGEDTDPDLEIVYVDIGSVDSLGRIVQTESLTFGSAPSRARRRVRDGDVIVSTVRTYLRAIAPIIDPVPNLVVSTGFAVVRPSNDLTSAYTAFTLRAPYFVEKVVANSKGVSFPAINESEVAAYMLAVPPPREQRAIAAFLNRETARIDALMARVHDAIDRLQELRTALISAAVTGKIDVREEIA